MDNFKVKNKDLKQQGFMVENNYCEQEAINTDIDLSNQSTRYTKNQNNIFSERETHDKQFTNIFEEIKQFHKKYSSVDQGSDKNLNEYQKSQTNSDQKSKTKSCIYQDQYQNQKKQKQRNNSNISKDIQNKRKNSSMKFHKKYDSQKKQFSVNIQDQRKNLQWQENQIVKLQTLCQQQKLKLIQKQQQEQQYKQDLQGIIRNLQSHIQQIQQSQKNSRNFLLVDLLKQLAKTNCNILPSCEEDGKYLFMIENEEIFQLKINAEERVSVQDFQYPIDSELNLDTVNNTQNSYILTGGKNSIKNNLFKFTPKFISSVQNLQNSEYNLNTNQEQILNSLSPHVQDFNTNTIENKIENQKQYPIQQLQSQQNTSQNNNQTNINDLININNQQQKIILDQLITLVTQESDIALITQNDIDSNNKNNNKLVNDQNQCNQNDQENMKYEKFIQKQLSDKKQDTSQEYNLRQTSRKSQVCINNECDFKEDLKNKDKTRSCDCNIF